MNVSVVQNLLRSAELHAERTAIARLGREVSYRQLLNNAVAVATFLTRDGIRPQDRVAIALASSAEYAAAFYGVLMAGGIVVPLNTGAKSRDFSVWLGHSEPGVVIGSRQDQELQAAMAESAPSASLIAVELGSEPVDFGSLLGVAADAPPRTSVEVDSPACIIYTSGTTGRPKGVLLSHGNLASNTASIIEYMGLTANDSILSVLPFYYSYGSSILHSHLAVGGRIVVEQNMVYPHLVAESMAKERVSGFAGVPSTYALLLSRVDLSHSDLQALRYVMQAGGAMSPAITKRLKEAVPHSKVYVMYGQTEATARLTYLPPERLEEKLGSAGIGIPGVQIEVRDEVGRRGGSGEVGEVWARGPNIMLGYWGDPAATANTINDGWLKTGDMGYLDADGFLFLIGRRSDIIKVGAHRVHPQDIEDVIVELPGVQEVAVAGVDDEVLGQTIKAFVVSRGDHTITPAEIQAHCRCRLANYKVPKAVEIVAQLPKTDSGKVQRAVLAGRAST